MTGTNDRDDQQAQWRSLPLDTGDALLEGTVTIGFADLVQSSRLLQRVGDAQFAALVRRVDEESRLVATRRLGHVPRFEGDGWMVVFGAARRALWWAAELHGAVARLRDELDPDLALRIGIHTGEALQDRSDFRGVHVHFAARVGAAAPTDGVYVSSLTAQIARGAPEFRFHNPQLVHFQGFDEPAELFEFDWRRLVGVPGPAESRDG